MRLCHFGHARIVVAGRVLVIGLGVVTCRCMLGFVSLSSTPRSTPTRLSERASTDRADLYAVLDAGLICHLGLIRGGAPVVLPTGYGRDGDTIYLHASTGAGYLRSVDGEPVKIRTGAPKDDADDIEVGGRWAGVLPIRSVLGPPEPDPMSAGDGRVPAHVASRVNPPPRSGAPTDHVR